MDVQALNHAGIPVSDLDRSLRFYRDVFGVTPQFITEYGEASLAGALRVPNPRIRIAFLKLADDVAVELLEYLEPAPKRFTSRDCDVGATHLCLQVADIDAAHRELRTKGVDVYAEPVLETDYGPFHGTKWVFFKDPDGITFELVQAASSTGP